MKFVILASLVAATFAADCTNSLTETLPTGYMFKIKTAADCTQTATAGTDVAAIPYKAADVAAKADNSDFTAKIGCASGYVADGTKVELDCTTPATTKLTGCKTKPAPATPAVIKGCPDIKVVAKADNYAEFQTGAGTNLQIMKKKCLPKGGKGQYGSNSWQCKGGSTSADGAWAAVAGGSCVAASWNAKSVVGQCPKPKCGVAASKVAVKCNTGTDSDCTGTAAQTDCPAAKVSGASCKDPTCDPTKTVADSPFKAVGVKKCTSTAKVATGTAFKGATYTTTCTLQWKGVDDVQANWVRTKNGSGGGSGGSGGSSASTLSIFAAFAVIVAYL